MNNPAAAVRPDLSLLGRPAAMWLFGISLFGLVLVWIAESALGVIQPTDRYGYPLLAAALGGLLALVWRHARHLLLAQRLGTLAVCAYFIAGVCAWSFSEPGAARDYGAATLGPWLMCAHLFIFVSFRRREAMLLACGFIVAIVVVPVLLAAAIGRPFPWDATLQPVILNVSLAQLVFAGLLAGAVRQVVRLAGHSPVDGQASMPATLSVDEVLGRRERELQRLLDDADRAKALSLASEAELRGMFEAFPGYVCRTDEHGRYDYVNAAYAAVWGRRPEDFEGLSLHDVLGSERWAANVARRARIAATARPLSFEIRHVMPDGRPRDFQVTQIALPQAAGKPRMHHELAIDISDRKAVELAMVAARLEAERAHRAKGEVLAVVAREVRAPMQAIRALAGTLEGGGGLRAAQVHHVREIAAAAGQVLARVDDLQQGVAARGSSELDPL